MEVKSVLNGSSFHKRRWMDTQNLFLLLRSELSDVHFKEQRKTKLIESATAMADKNKGSTDV